MTTVSPSLLDRQTESCSELSSAASVRVGGRRTGATTTGACNSTSNVDDDERSGFAAQAARDVDPMDQSTATGSILSTMFEQTVDIFTSDGERQRTQRNAIFAFSVRCISAALLYATQIVLARWMGTSDYGIYVFVWTWVLILGGLSHIGLNVVTIRMAPAYRAADDFALLRGLTFGTRLSALATSSLVAAAGMVGLWLFGDHLQSHYVLPLYLALVCVPMFALTDVQDGIGRGHAWMDVSLVPPYILRPMMLLATMLAANTLGYAMTATTAAGAAIVATWTAAVFQTVLLNRRLSATMPRGPRSYDFPGWFKISLPLLVIIGCEILLQNTDLLVISHFMTPADVGIYFAAGKTMALILFVHYAVGSAVAHKFSELHARGDQAALRAFVSDAVNWTFWPSLVGGIVILALGKPLLWLFGPQFAEGYPVMGILVAGFLVRSAMGPTEYLLNMLGEQKMCATVLSAAAVVNIALNIWLVPIYGLIGAAVATSTAMALAASLQAVVVRRKLGIKVAIWHNLPGSNAV